MPIVPDRYATARVGNLRDVRVFPRLAAFTDWRLKESD